MKKSLLVITLTLLIALISGCSDSSSGTTQTVTGSNYENLDKIPVSDKVLNFPASFYTSNTVELTNPRTGTGTYYPILISPAMGFNGIADLTQFGYGIVKGVGYDVAFGSSTMNPKNLTFGRYNKDEFFHFMYDLNSATGLQTNETGTYYARFEAWNNNNFPTDGTFIFAFLTQEEAAKYIPTNDSINPTPINGGPSYLSQEVLNQLIELGALVQYKWTATNGSTQTVTGSNYENLDKIPVSDKVLNFPANFYTSNTVEVTNPRTGTGTYYPILISPAMGFNGTADLSFYGMGIVNGVGYEVEFGSSTTNRRNLTFGRYDERPMFYFMYDLNTATSLQANETGTYYTNFIAWNNNFFPSEGTFIFAFLTQEEAAKYIPTNDFINFFPSYGGPSYLSQEVLNQLIELDALVQYKWTAVK